jgi:tRNA G46 methylase TrmB
MTIQNISFTQTDVTGITSLLFDEKEIQDISPEIEIRFGKIEISKSGKPFFNSDVGIKRYNEVLNRIKYLKNYSVMKTVKDKILYKGSFRYIKSEDGTSLYQHKIKSIDKDITIVPTFSQVEGGIKKEEETIRFSKAYEKQILEKDWNSSQEEQKLSVERERTSFLMQDYVFDLTKKTYNTGKIAYEIEAEFNVDFIKEIIKKGKSNFLEFMVKVKSILNNIYSNIHSLCSGEYFQPIQDKINSFTNKKPLELRPKNISDEDVISTKIKNYAVTNKLDGVGYNLIFMSQTIGKNSFIIPIAYNSVDIIRLASVKAENIKGDISYILKSLSNVEIYFIEDTTSMFSIEVHFFDTLLYGEEKTYTKDLKSRLDTSKIISEFCINNFGSPNLTFEVKRFFYDSDDIIKNIKDTIEYMNERYDIDVIKYNDGIIFQPLGSYYFSRVGEIIPTKESILKWKFPSKVTIDFLLKDYIKISDDAIVYNLYSKTKPETFEIFKDKYTFNEHSIKLFINDTFDGIKATQLGGKVVELGVENGEWKIHRIRYDKGPDKTNHIITANVTFLDMLYEFTLPYLIELIKFSNNIIHERPQKNKTMDIEKISVVETLKKQLFVQKPKEAKNADTTWLFPNTDRVKGQRITDIGLKTITRPKDAKNITEHIIKKYYELFKKDTKNAIITDAMAGNGGNVFSFSLRFKKVNAIEIDETTSDILQHNIKLYNIKNVTIFQDNFLNVINNIQQNIIYIDPFIGEKGTKDIIIDNKKLSEIVNIISPYTELIVIKLSKGINVLDLKPNSIDDFTYFNLITIVPSFTKKDEEEEKGIPNLRKLANKVKKQYIEHSKGKIVVDIGSGVGGDLYKYEQIKPKELYLVEPSENNLKEMEKRIEIHKDDLNYITKDLKYLNAGGEEYEKIVNFVNKKVDVVNMFFSLTFFFKDKNTLESLANTIDQLLGPEGYFIGTTMSLTSFGEGDIVKDSYTIKIKSNDQTKKILGNEVIINIKNTKTATYQIEYVVNLEYLQFILATKGIYLENILQFKDLDTSFLTEDELYLNKAYYGFIFKRKPLSITKENNATIIPIKNNSGFVNEMWYRYGVPGDGSCLFHSVIYSLSKGYYDSSKNDYNPELYKDLAIDLRDKIADSFTLSEFSKLQNGNISTILMHQILQTKTTLSCFKKVPDTLTEELFKQKIDNLISNNSGVNNIQKLNNIFVDEMIEIGLDKEESEDIFKGLYLISYLQYSELIKDKSYWVDQSLTLLLAEKLKINIVIISSNTMSVYKDAGNFNPEYLSIVIFNVDGMHFEPMSRNKTQYIFTLDELRTIL